ncbi:unnamed protein product [Lasius platythorax]|uniref:Uncharacterized protein n=1 Tax=Lasius platythorax TaxID=488582 RepID=A0AAV2P8U7_9HYME
MPSQNERQNERKCASRMEQRDRQGWRVREKGGEFVSRVEVCATQTGLSRITQTSRETMGHHDRPSTTSPLFRIAVDLADNGGQSRVARDRET